MNESPQRLAISLKQIGYSLGLFFIVQLGDLLENRRLMVTIVMVAVVTDPAT